MGVHHIALATADLDRTDSFYTEAMGFELVKCVTALTPEGGWAKHVFYRNPDITEGAPGMIAFWDLHGDYPVPTNGMSRSVGLPEWVNHLAFHATSAEDLQRRRSRWTDLGLEVFEINHGFCRSIYTHDPNGTLVEWCCDLRELDDDDRIEALKAISDPAPTLEEPPSDVQHFPADPTRQPEWALHPD
ncbi:MAG: VOC family protein [Actinomycetota bacterium]|jgi:catechol 2,3-dioxygenase-like lactoylglutathione lyase family enzyme